MTIYICFKKVTFECLCPNLDTSNVKWNDLGYIWFLSAGLEVCISFKRNGTSDRKVLGISGSAVFYAVCRHQISWQIDYESHDAVRCPRTRGFPSISAVRSSTDRTVILCTYGSYNYRKHFWQDQKPLEFQCMYSVTCQLCHVVLQLPEKCIYTTTLPSFGLAS